MKWILAILFLMGTSAFGQVDDTTKYISYPNQYGMKIPRIWAPTTMIMPYGDTTGKRPGKIGAFMTCVCDGKPYRWDGTNWVAFGGSGSRFGLDDITATGTRAFDANGNIFKIDSVSQYYLTTKTKTSGVDKGLYNRLEMDNGNIYLIVSPSTGPSPRSYGFSAHSMLTQMFARGHVSGNDGYVQADTTQVLLESDPNRLEVRHDSVTLSNIEDGELDFRIRVLPQTIDTTNYKPATIGPNGQMKIMGGWPGSGAGSGISGLTAGRVTLSTSGTTVGDDADLTYNSTSNEITTDSAILKKGKIDTVRVQVADSKTQKRAIFCGTSVSAGGGTTDVSLASDTSRRWTTYFCRSQGLQEVNFAVPGMVMQDRSPSSTNFIDDRMPFVPPYNAATDTLIFYEFSINDVTKTGQGLTNYNTTNFIADYSTAIDDAIAKGWPLNRIFIITSNWVDPTLNSNNSQANQDAYYVATKTVATNKGVGLIDVYQNSYVNRGHYFYSDGLHPSNSGHSEFAIKVLNDVGASVYKDAQTIAANGVTELQKIRVKGSDTANVNYQVLGVDQYNNATKLSNGYFIENNPIVKQYGGINLGGDIKGTRLFSSGMTMAQGNFNFTNVTGSGLFGYWDGTAAGIGGIQVTPSLSWQPININAGGSYIGLGTSQNGIDRVATTTLKASGYIRAKGQPPGTFEGGDEVFMATQDGIGYFASFDGTGITGRPLSINYWGGQTMIGANSTVGSAKLYINGNQYINGSLGVGNSTPVNKLTIGGSFQTPNSATGMKINLEPIRITENTLAINSTVSEVAVNRFGADTLDALNSGQTYTEASTVIIDGAPSGSSNVTNTFAWALKIKSGKVKLGTVDSTGSPANMLWQDPNTGEIKKAAVPSGGGSDGNGIYSGNGSLSGNTTITGAGNTLTMTGTQSSAAAFNVANTGNGMAISGTTSGTGSAITGSNSNGGAGIFGSSSSGTGLVAESTTGEALSAYVIPSSTNARATIGRLTRYSSGTASNGISGSFDWFTQSSNGSAQRSNMIASVWTNATTATRTSTLEIYGVNSGTEARKLAISGTGQITEDGYGTGSFTVTPATTPVYSSTGVKGERIAPKIYTVLLSQSGTSDPTATVLGTNEIGAIVWTRNSTGSYTGTLTGAFTNNKTWLICQKGDGSGSFVNTLISRTGDNTIALDVRDNVNSLTDGFTNMSIEIRVYP